MNGLFRLLELFFAIEQDQRVDVAITDVADMTSLEAASVEVRLDLGDEGR
jgi:hypothetical protein